MHGPMQWTRGGMVPIGAPLGVHVDTLPEDEEGDGDDVDAIIETPSISSAQRKAKATKVAKLEPAPNILKLARKRLRDVERELKRIRPLEKERDELRRLIDAATNTSRAVVREIRKTSAG